jgi:hypothetical protein
MKSSKERFVIIVAEKNSLTSCVNRSMWRWSKAPQCFVLMRKADSRR